MTPEEKDNPSTSRRYTTDSGMGGTFTVRYRGMFKGKHHFIVCEGAFTGQQHTVNQEALQTYIKGYAHQSQE